MNIHAAEKSRHILEKIDCSKTIKSKIMNFLRTLNPHVLNSDEISYFEDSFTEVFVKFDEGKIKEIEKIN